MIDTFQKRTIIDIIFTILLFWLSIHCILPVIMLNTFSSQLPGKSKQAEIPSAISKEFGF